MRVTPDLKYPHCCICGKREAYIAQVGIALGMGGFDYNFCKSCASSTTLEEFFKALFGEQRLAWPPKLKGPTDGL